MEAETSLWVLLTWVMLGVMFGGAITASFWARRRRREGREASSYNAEGAGAMVVPLNNRGQMTEEDAVSDSPPLWSLRMWIVERIQRVGDWVEKWFPQQPGTPMGPW